MIAPFLEALFDDGRVRVDHPDEAVTEDDLRNAAQVLQAAERVQRESFPGEPPPFSLPAANWAARVFYRACQAATFRDLPAESLPAFLGEACVPGEPPSVHYSVDLVFRFLPDLCKLAGHLAPADPLLEPLRLWANQWPLSSVGMKDVTPQSLLGIVDHPAVLQYYVDRIIARGDVSRLDEPAVLNAVRRTLNIYSDRFSPFAQRLVAGCQT